jgi:hypothetical protein
VGFEASMMSLRDGKIAEYREVFNMFDRADGLSGASQDPQARAKQLRSSQMDAASA